MRTNQLKWHQSSGRFDAGGERRRGSGYDRWLLSLDGVRTSTLTASLCYPFLAQPSLTNAGTYIGTNLLSGAAFVLDPFVLYQQRIIQNPNLLITGDIGYGKTNLLFALTLRSLPFGRHVAAIDVKPDWARVAVLYGGQAIIIGGAGTVLNPLDVDPVALAKLAATGDVDVAAIAAEHQLVVISSLLAQKLRRPIDAGRFESSALTTALEEANRATGGEPILSDVYQALCEPSRDLPGELRVTREEYMAATAELRGAFHSLLSGRTGRLFNGRSTVKFDATKPVVAIDVSALMHDTENLPLAYACVGAWLASALMSAPGLWWNVWDEVWKALQLAPDMVGLLQHLYRLSRLYGIANVIAVHNASDVGAIADAGSAQSEQAKQLLSLAATHIIGRTPHREVPYTAEVADLTDTEAAIIERSEIGEFIAKVRGTHVNRSFRISVVRHRYEVDWWDTSSAMLDPQEPAA